MCGGSEVYLRNVWKSYLLPVSVEGDAFKYSVRVLIELKHFAMGGSLQYVVKASDDTGACVWVEGSADLGGG
jgi:hypothetical protein